MSPASYRAAPPRVGRPTIPAVRQGAARSPALPPAGHPVGVAGAEVVEPDFDDDAAAFCADWYAATAFCRSASALPMPAKSAFFWAAASAVSAALISDTAWFIAG